MRDDTKELLQIRDRTVGTLIPDSGPLSPRPRQQQKHPDGSATELTLKNAVVLNSRVCSPDYNIVGYWDCCLSSGQNTIAYWTVLYMRIGIYARPLTSQRSRTL